MHLKRLELYGFKSFADRTELRFDSGITGIVGPNGSGKSNVADAVRWVLGEQSARTLRGVRMEDIIFTGTDTRKPLGFCEVSLIFDNYDKALPIDFAEVMVTRRVFRNGEGEYAINRTPCRLKDIVELFRDTGIGKEGYSIIGQGRIDEILSARSEDRRQVFEEAVGIVRYKARKEEAEKRIETTRQNMLRIDDILEEIVGRLGPLEEQAEAARRYLALSGEQRGLDLGVFLHEHERITRRAALIGAQLEELVNQQAQIEESCGIGVRERDEARRRLDALEGDAAALREKKSEAVRHADALENAQRVDAEREAGWLREGERIDAELDAVARQRAHDGKASLEDDLEDRRGALERLRQSHAEMEGAAEALAAEALAAEEALDALKAQRIEALNRSADAKAAAARLEAMRDGLAGRLEDVRIEHAAAEEGRAGVDARIAEARSAYAAAEAALAGVAGRRAAAQKLSAEEAQRVEALTRQRAALEGNARELASRERMLADMARDYEGYQNSVRVVMRHAKSTGVRGVHGVVAELIAVPRDIEAAIDMALGAGAQNIVVEREEDAKILIEHLRTNRLGRATFLPLSAMRPRTLNQEERSVLSMEGCIGVASELVSYDARYRGAMENLLGRTVIARDLDTGIAVMRRARHAFRLVTLDGDVMHSGGSMTGGSQQSRSTGLLSRERELGEAREALRRNAGKLDALTAELEASSGARAQLKERVAALFEEERSAEIAMAREGERSEKAREALERHGQVLAAILEEAEALEGQIADIAAELEAARRPAVQEISQETLLLRIEEQQAALAEARMRRDAAREEATQRRVEAAEAARELAAAERDVRRMREERDQASRRMEALAAERAGLEGRIAEHRAAAEDRAREARAAAERMREHSALLEALEAERAEAYRLERAAGERAERLSADLSALKDRVLRIDVQRDRLADELSALCDRIWNEYELTLAGARDHAPGEGFELRAASARLAVIRAEIREMGAVNVNAVEECAQVRARRDELMRQRGDLDAAEADLHRIIEDLTRRMRKQFVEGMEQLNGHFARVFARLFRGGTARLLLQDESDPLASGIDIVAQMPGKKTQLLSLLSGGERALTAIAILFAMLCVKPTPFCILDEIEAALDEANIAAFADVLAEFSRDTQFIVVTHRKGTMERCDGLYGMAMEEKGISRLVSVRLADVS